MSRYHLTAGSSGRLLGDYDDLVLATRRARLWANTHRRPVAIYEGGVLIGEIESST
jgi:hypothetical protein